MSEPQPRPDDSRPDDSLPADEADLLRLASADNFRDVAGISGPGLPTGDGGRMRRGVVYRSNELLLSDDDVARLVALGVCGVYDLRDHWEVEAHPDAVVEGATWEGLPVGGIPPETGSALPDPGAAEEAMRAVYRGFVDDAANRASFGTLLRRLAAARGPQLFHCTAGKDRTGWAAMLLHHVAGVPAEVARREYVLTNDISSATRTKYLGLVREHLGEDRVPVFERTMVADLDYLDAALAAVQQRFGSLDAYLADGLDLTPDDLGGLRARLLGP